MNNRGTFGSSFGTIAVMAGSVVGLGNIWRFPFIAGQGGGAAFVLIYIAVSLLISIPILLTEVSIGRATGKNSYGAFKQLSKSKFWRITGLLGVLSPFVILSYYTIIAGWSLDFVYQSVTNNFAGQSPEQIKDSFGAFISSGFKPIAWAILFVVMSCAIILGGVNKGIEKYNKVLMPFMIVILLVLIVNSTTLSGWGEGVSFLLKPDFSKLTWSVALTALGQSFYSMSIGMGAMVVYGSYVKKDANLYKIGLTTSLCDVGVAILSGLAIFPAVFTFGLAPSEGAELVFITLPNIFTHMSGGYYLSIIFFSLLFLAAITSSLSLIEPIVAFVQEEFKLSRKRSTVVVGIALSVVGVLCGISMMPDSAIKLFGMNIFDFSDVFSSLVIIPLIALMTVLFAGWVLSKDLFKAQLTSYGIHPARYITNLVLFIIKYIAPFVIILLVVTKLI